MRKILIVFTIAILTMMACEHQMEKEMTFELSKVKEYEELFIEPKVDPMKKSFETFEEAIDEYEKTLVAEGESHWLDSTRIRLTRKKQYGKFPGFQDRYYVEIDLSFRTKKQYERLNEIVEKVVELADQYLHKGYQTLIFDTWAYTDNIPYSHGEKYTYKRK